MVKKKKKRERRRSQIMFAEKYPGLAQYSTQNYCKVYVIEKKKKELNTFF